VERIREHQIINKRGEDELGVVYEAVSPEGSRVAIKVIHPSLGASDVVRARLFREVLALSRIEHAGLPRLLGFGPIEGTFFIIEELVEGPTLEEIARVDVARAIEIAGELLEILAAAHASGVVHRSLGPSDVISTPRGLKIVRLGMSTVLDGLGADDAGVRADLFATGRILHELLTGDVPGVGPALRSIEPPLPESLIRVYERLTAPDPADRFSDAAAALFALRGITSPEAPAASPFAEIGALRVRVEPSFQLRAYGDEADPIARCLLEIELRKIGGAQASAPPAEIYLVLDVSGSMDAPDRYPLLRIAVRELLDRIDPNDRLGIAVFSTDADEITPIVSAADARLESALLLDRMDRSDRKFGGGTHLAPGLTRALAALRRRSSGAVRRTYVLTDGEIHDREACERVLGEFRRAGIEVHVYGFGTEFDAAALKRLVSDQLGGSVKPIATEEDIVATFSHIAEVNKRLVAREAMLEIELCDSIEGGDAWSFRPQARYFGPIAGRRLVREIGAVEDGRLYAFLTEVRLPPDPGSRRTPIAKVRLHWHDGQTKAEHRLEIAAPRAPIGTLTGQDANARVEKAFTMLDALRKQGDPKAQLRALKSRLELARLEGRDPDLLEAVTKQIEVLEGRAHPGTVSARDHTLLSSDESTNIGDIGRGSDAGHA
jgi:hypothetical protein